jgi:hypothetical protein
MLTWDLATSITYYANTELNIELSVVAEQAGVHYIIGALYTREGVYIPDTLFGIVLPEGSAYGIASSVEAKTWEMVISESIILPCKLTLNRTDAMLGLFFMKMVGATAVPDTDIIAGQVSAYLNAPSAPVEVVAIAIPAMLLLAFFTMITNEEVPK